MIVSKITGGLGNQLFAYAHGLSLAKANNTDLWCDLSAYKKKTERPLELRNLFPGHIKHSAAANLLKYWRRVKENSFTFDASLNDVSNNHYVEGYYQSEKYFKNVKGEMNSLFDGIHFDYIREIVQEIGADTALHIRRGDYLKSVRHYALPMEYYNKAIELAKSQKVVVFSDDKNYARVFCGAVKDLGVDAVYWDVIDAVHDMAAMSMFSKIITANSSFSWWAAYNSDAIVVCPKRYFSHEQDMKDFYPKHWFQI